MPHLRERKDDIPAFAEFFLEKYRNELRKPILRFDKESMNALLMYDYPGNIRELENIVERAVVLAEGDVLSINDLPEEIQYKNPKQHDRRNNKRGNDRRIYNRRRPRQYAIWKKMLFAKR